MNAMSRSHDSFATCEMHHVTHCACTVIQLLFLVGVFLAPCARCNSD